MKLGSNTDHLIGRPSPATQPVMHYIFMIQSSPVVLRPQIVLGPLDQIGTQVSSNLRYLSVKRLRLHPGRTIHLRLNSQTKMQAPMSLVLSRSQMNSQFISMICAGEIDSHKIPIVQEQHSQIQITKKILRTPC